MTLEQKISLCTGADSWHTTAIEELAVPSLTMSDGTNGVRFQKPRRLTAPCNLYDATVNFSFDNELLRTPMRPPAILRAPPLHAAGPLPWPVKSARRLPWNAEPGASAFCWDPE